MPGNTYKWLGGQAGAPDPNDATVAANWLIEPGGTSDGMVPQPGDTALIASGTADLFFPASEPTEISDLTFDLSGGGTLSLDNATLDDTSSVSVGAGQTGVFAVGAGVQSSASMDADGADTVLDVTLSGTFDLQNAIFAQTGGTVLVTETAGGTLDNNGGVAALGGNITLDTSVIGTGLLVVGNGTLVVNGAVQGGQAAVFTGADATLVIDQQASFAARVLGFQAGDTIDLPNIQFSSLKPITLVNNIATISDGSGDTAELGFPGAGFTVGDLTATSDATGGTQLTVPGVVDPLWQGESGTWDTGADWSTGSAPGSADTAVIAQATPTFDIATSVPTSVGAVVMLAPHGTLTVNSTLNASRDIFETVGTIAVVTGGKIVTKVFSEVAGGALLTMADGTQIIANGGGSLGNGNGISALEIEGNAELTGVVAVFEGTSRIGASGNGSMTIDAGSNVKSSYTDLGASGSASGTLVLDNSVLEDDGVDGTAPLLAGFMLVGGGALGPGGSLSGGSGTLTIQDGAVETDFGAIIGVAAASSGTVAVQDGGHWVVDTNLTVGNNAGASATLFVQQGPSLHTGGTLSVDGTLAVDGTLFVDGGGTGTADALSFTGGSIGVDGSSLLNIGTSGPSGDQGLVIDPGANASFSGYGSFAGLLTVLGSLVTSGATFNGTLAGAGTVDIDGASTLTINDATNWTTDIAFAGPNGVLALSDNAADQGKIFFTPAVAGYADTIDLTGLTYDAIREPTGYDPSTDVLTLGGGELVPVMVTGIAAPANTLFSLQQDTGTGTDIVMTAPCYAAGTRLATPGGAAAVETLQAGDLVLALEGGVTVPRPVRWVGRFCVDLARHPAPERVAPVRIVADAFAPGVPQRDLLVSPGHAILVDDVLIQARSLINGASIVQERGRRLVTYFHVELDRHGILLAERLPAESYLDTGQRGMFAGETGARPLHADLATGWALQLCWEQACAPLVLVGPRVTAAHARLFSRAKTLGDRPTAEAAPRVFAQVA